MIFLKYISDTFVEQQKKVLEMVSIPDSDYYLWDDPKDHQNALEDRNYYRQENVRAKLRLKIKTLLKRYKYPPDEQITAVETVLRQA